MIKNYLKIALRNLRKHTLYAVINITGLAIGIAVCLLIFLFAQDELRYDAFHEQEDRIYRVNSALGQPGRRNLVAVTAQPLGPTLKAEFPDVEHAVRFWEYDDVVGTGERTFTERMTFADPEVFDVFTFPLLVGDATTALQQPDGVVLTAATARKYFGTADVLGQPLSIKLGEEFYPFTITGVAAPLPGPSSITFDLLLPFERTTAIRSPRNAESWRSSSMHTYVLLGSQASPNAVAALFPALIDKYIGTDNTSIDYRLQPLHDIHLNPAVGAGLTPPSNPAYSYILGGIALLVLCIAAINFTNLSIAGASRRAAEIGVRKTVGALRYQLIWQFWGEALLLSGLALLLGLALADLFLPVFNDLANKTLHLNLTTSGLTLAVLFGITLLTGLLAGAYPALVLSAFRPVEVLKGQVRHFRASTLTRSLVVLQFALSVFLIVSTLLMKQQLDFLRTKDLGLSTEHVVVLPTHTQRGARLMERMRGVLAGHEDILGISGASSVPFNDEGNAMVYVEVNDEDFFFPITYRVDPSFMQTLGIDLVDGRTFSPDLATDTLQAIVVNEALVARMNWDNGIGQTLPINGEPHTVIGVAKNFHFRSLHNAIDPVVLHAKPDWSIDYLLVKVRGDDLPATLATLRGAWQRVAPDFPFDYSFLDDTFDQQYRAEERWGRIVGYAAGFAILIACMGLLGLIVLAVTHRTKEIGVRKVFGARTQDVLSLLVRDVVWLVLLAVVVATPVVYLVMHRWLDDFAYRISIGVGPFVMTAVLVLALAVLTAGYHAIRAAHADPVQSLRYE